MKICIHRGTKEIGGTCIEIEAQGKRIVLDIGLPLDAPEDEESLDNLLPTVSGFTEQDTSLLAVLISHLHMDHYGLARKIRRDIPIWIGKDAHNIMKAASPYVPNGFALDSPQYLSNGHTVNIGPFRITPFLVDHSAFDAYALLIEADGKRVFYSGDFRGHGRKRRLFEEMLVNPPGNIDVMLMEGTTIGRAGSKEGFLTESDLEDEFTRAFKQTEGLHFVWTSSQNIDRIVTIFRAAKKANRLLLIDLYTAEILKATGRDTIPQSNWSDVKLYVPHRQKVHILKNKLFDSLEQHKVNRIYPEKLPDIATKSVMIFRPIAIGDKGVEKSLAGSALSYSLWEGYLQEESSRRALTWLKKNNIPLEVIHTSGHASVVSLERFASALKPNRLVPIHTFEPEKFSDQFSNVECQQDGVWWEV